MSREREFAYIQARVQARHGARPGDAQWRRLESIDELAGYLHGLRETSLSPWVRPLTPSHSSHDIERTLRGQWSAYVNRVSTWAPEPWRPAIACLSRLPELPALAYLRREGRPLAWFEKDPQLKFAKSESVPARPLDDWLAQWRQSWPRMSAGQREALIKLRDVVSDHLQSMDQAGDAQEGDKIREQLEAAFRRLFRRYAQSIVAVFCHLGLTAIDVERMRGGLVRRALFAPGAGASQ